MKRKYNIMVITIMMLLMMTGISVQSAASSLGSINVELPNRTEVFLYKVADYDGNKYTPAENLKDSGISMDALISNPSDAAAKAVYNYLRRNYEEDYATSSFRGTAKFYDLNLGIWLVCGAPDNKMKFKPFFVFIPTEANGMKNYVIHATPKLDEDDSDNINLMVTKKWDDDNNTSNERPKSVTVNLLLNGETVDKIKLSESNGWNYTFKDLENVEGYSVEEVEVDRYTAEYAGDVEEGFIIINIHEDNKLPQTGQKWIPIIILFIAGIACITLGIIESRERKNENKA